MCEKCDNLNYQPVNGNMLLDEDEVENGLDLTIDRAAVHYKRFLEELGFDLRDPNMAETPKRVAKMYLMELFRGTWEQPPVITTFEIPEKDRPVGDEMLISGPLTVKSTCAHHMMPITGKAWIGLFLGKSPKGLPGLSKYKRVLDWYARRPQLQEQLTIQVRDHLVKELEIDQEHGGVMVVIKAEHGCMTCRGVNEHDSEMVTSALYGRFFNPTIRQEFFSLSSLK